MDERQVSGVFHVRGVDDDGRPLLVKVYGRDAYDTQVVATLWRTIWYRGSALTSGRSRLHSAEREAFVTLLARNAGLATREVVTAGATIDDDALLVLRGEAQPFAALEPDRLDDALLRSAWRSLELLGELRIAHQQIDPSTIVVVGREAGFVDLGEATLAPDARQLTTDRAQLLVRTASLVGNERALRVAVDAVGADGVAELVPYLQAAAFSTSLRRQLRAASLDVDELREQAAAAVGIEPPEVVKLRRVTKWAAVQLALLVLAAYTIIDAASGVDWDEVASTVADASWAWIAGASRGRAAAAADAGGRDARLGSGPAPVRPGVRDAAGDRLHERRAPVEPGADGGQHPLLPAAGPLGAHRRRLRRDRLVREHGRPGAPARPAAALLRVDARARPAPPLRRRARRCSGSWSARSSPRC